jgi:histidinol-phosphate aminotransferase
VRSPRQSSRTADWILPGTGSSELLRLTPVAHARQGGNVVTPHETWGGSLAVAEHLGLEIRRIKLLPDQDLAFDVDRMLDAVDDETRIFHLVTPNNPTGTTLGYAGIKRIADALPKDVLFVLDQAYVDYSTEEQSGLDLLKAGYTNVLVTRTFSKVYAMAGLRCGYGLAHPDILKETGKFGCGPASINMAGYGAVLGSLDDTQHAVRSRSYVQETRDYYRDRFDALGIRTVSGPTPFILAEFGDRSKTIHQELEKRKVFVTHGSTWHLPDYVRISYGTPAENEAFFDVLETLTKA